MPGYYPIIYVRGFALSDSEVDETSDDPTNGFNLGSTHARQGRNERILKFRFPGPFVRLMTEHGYTDSIAGETDSVEFAPDPIRTLWIYRYYEAYSDTFEAKGLPGRPKMEDLAWNLGRFIENVITQVYGGTSPAPRDMPRKVILVAHSMGGLICRSLMAQVLRDKSEDRIEKFVTYGTPHGGIELSRLSIPDFARGLIGWHDINNFSPRRMFQYLTPLMTNTEGKKDPAKLEFDPKFDPRGMPTFFDPEKVLCIVGTNPTDYKVASELSRRILGGPASDGLVQIKNAWVNGADRVDIHCSHSGRYGIVNSNQGYQAMQRFLFGKWRGAVDIQVQNPIDPDGGDGHPEEGRGGLPRSGGPRGGGGGAAHLLDVECTLGRNSLALSSRKAEHLNALELGGTMRARLQVFHLMDSDLEEEDDERSNQLNSESAKSFRIQLRLRLRHDQYDAAEVLTFSDLLMEQPVEIRVTPQEAGIADAVVRYRWPNAKSRWEIATRQRSSHVIPIPQGRSVETWGTEARLYLTFTDWNPEGEQEVVERSRWLDVRKNEIERKKSRGQIHSSGKKRETVRA